MASARPRRRIAVLTCMDARIDPLAVLGLELGDAHVIRNAGGLVTDDAIRSLGVSQRALGTTEIVVVMHEDCGMEGAPEELGGFDDLETELRNGLARLRDSDALVTRDRIRGLVFDPHTGSVREADPGT
jgi:carbonic anhydrase